MAALDLSEFRVKLDFFVGPVASCDFRTVYMYFFFFEQYTTSPTLLIEYIS